MEVLRATLTRELTFSTKEEPASTVADTTMIHPATRGDQRKTRANSTLSTTTARQRRWNANPGETAGAWWDNTGWLDARESAAVAGGYSTEFDLSTYFLHDVPPEVAAEGEAHQRPEANAVFGSVCDFVDWPAIPIRVLAGGGDRFFPLDFQRGVAGDRLGLEPDVVPGGHLVAVSNPNGVADYLLHR